MAGDGDEVGFHLVQLAQPLHGFLLLREQPVGVRDQCDLVRETGQEVQRSFVERRRRAALHVEDPDDLVTDLHRSGHLGTHLRVDRNVAGEGRNIGDGDPLPRGGHGSRDATPERDAFFVEGHPVHALHRELVSFPEQDREALIAEVASDGVGHEPKGAVQVFGGHARQDRGVERGELAAGRCLAPSRLIRPPRLLLRLLRLPGQGASHEPADEGDDPLDPDPERHVRDQEGISVDERAPGDDGMREPISEIGLPRELVGQGEHHGPDRALQLIPERTLEGQDVDDHPGGALRVVAVDPGRAEDQGGVKEERGESEATHGRQGRQPGRSDPDEHVPGCERAHDRVRGRNDGVRRAGGRAQVRLRNQIEAEEDGEPPHPDEPELEAPGLLQILGLPRQHVDQGRVPVRRYNGGQGLAYARPIEAHSMFDALTSRFDAVFGKLRSRGKLHPKQVDGALADMRTALLEADVALDVVNDFLDRVRRRALSDEVMRSLTPAQQVVKIVRDELQTTLGGEHHPFRLPGANPVVIMMAGVQGSGKTTHCAKLALHLKEKGKQPLLVAGDLQRPAAIEQLFALGREIAVPVASEGNKPEKVAITLPVCPLHSGSTLVSGSRTSAGTSLIGADCTEERQPLASLTWTVWVVGV